MTLLSPHFSLEELTASTLATRLNIDNTPTQSIIDHLKSLAFGLEKIRSTLGNFTIHIDSAYRCQELNIAVGGAIHSAHMSGYAADFVCPDFGSPKDIITSISKSGILFDQCIHEGTWVHISFDPRLRQDVLTAHFGNGRTFYT